MQVTHNGREYVYGHDPRITPRLGVPGPRLPASWYKISAHLRLADVVDQVGPLYTMATEIRPLWPYTGQMVGSALTVKPWPRDDLAIHGSLAMASPGDVLAVDCRGRVTATAAA